MSVENKEEGNGAEKSEKKVAKKDIPSGVGTGRVRPEREQVEMLKNLQAILSHPNLTEAYKSRHPGDNQPSSHAYRMITPELLEELRKILAVDPKIRTSRTTIERFLYMMLSQYTAGEIKASDALKAIEILTKLVPDFKDRIGIEDLNNVPESELDERLKRLGFVDPKSKN